MAAALESLPPEILQEVASWLDWRSLQRLERVSARCRGAVALHLGRLRVFRVPEADVLDVELGALLPRLTALRELHVDLNHEKASRKELEVMEALVAASRRWPQLQRLTIDLPSCFNMFPGNDWRPMPAQLGQLCANCPRLTDVALTSGADKQCVLAVLAALPGLRALRVSGSRVLKKGAWLSQLPAELRLLSVELYRYPVDWSISMMLCPMALAQLARCGELRSLELLVEVGLRPEHLAAGLAGCTRLERLRLTARDVSVSDCLPPTGLHALRHLDLTRCRLTDADLRRLLERLPRLESVCLAGCCSTTPSGLALLGRLPALSSLSLVGADGVSDCVLDRLSAAPLVELQLGGDRVEFMRDVTLEGLLRLTQSCPTLRTVMLWDYLRLVERVA